MNENKPSSCEVSYPTYRTLVYYFELVQISFHVNDSAIAIPIKVIHLVNRSIIKFYLVEISCLGCDHASVTKAVEV